MAQFHISKDPLGKTPNALGHKSLFVNHAKKLFQPGITLFSNEISPL